MQEPFDMDAFLNDLREDEQPAFPNSALLCTLLHHLWKNHPLKISQSINLVALSEDMAFDLSDVQYIRKDAYGDYALHFKTNGEVVSISPYTEEYTSLVTLMHVFNRFPEH